MVSDKLTTMLVLSSQDFQQRVPRFHQTFCSDPKTHSLNSLQPGSDAADRAHWPSVLPTIHLNHSLQFNRSIARSRRVLPCTNSSADRSVVTPAGVDPHRRAFEVQPAQTGGLISHRENRRYL